MSNDANTAAAIAAAEAVAEMTRYFRWQRALDRVPNFDGKESELRSFVFDVEQAFASLGANADESEFVKQVVVKIRGSARECLDSKTFCDIKSLVKVLKESFAASGLPFAHYLTQLSQLKMSNAETVTEYASKTRGLINKAKAALSNEYGEEQIPLFTPIMTQSALDGFLRGLRSDIELRVAIKTPQSLEMAIEIARDEERRANDRNPNPRNLATHTGAFPRPFQNAGLREPAPLGMPRPLPPGFPRNNFSNESRFSSRPQSHWTPRPKFSHEGELKRQFMTPRNPHHFQPPVPRYADQQPAKVHYTAECHPSAQGYPDYYEHYYPSTYEYQGENQSHYHPDYDYSYRGTFYAAPPFSSVPYYQYAGSEEGEGHATPTGIGIRNDSSETSANVIAQGAGPSTGHLNSASARPTDRQASAIPEKVSTVPTYTIMKASGLQAKDVTTQK